ncbi:acyl carrier protein [Streptomyces sp. RTd22]|uniref:acyl carrier protein n=1 Tax=Streptomyces sp. RTd22 TaxID=1841249 RepID=UPI000B2BCB87|nr:phosphopantetheine-binding protein [Streptomyces sp. RTd22]
MTAGADTAASTEAGVTVRADLLDCLQVNLALLADRHHGPGTHLRLGARLRFAPRPGPGGLPTVEPTLDDHLADAAELLGLTVATRISGADHPVVAATGPVYVVADAHYLPWVPYFGRKHVEHSFLVEPGADGDTVQVTDGYHNDTQWGKARPGTHTYGRDELAAILAADPQGVEVLHLVPRPLGPAPRPAADLDADRAAAYLGAYAEHPDRTAALERFTLETWLLARARKLYAQYAAGGPEAAVDPAAAEHLARWDGVVEHAYLTFRRVARGRAEPPELLARAAEVLRADATALTGGGPAAEPGGGAATGDGELRPTVRAVVASVLALDEHLVPDTELTGLAEFSSLRMVEIVEGLEAAFDVEFGPDDLVPEKLHRIDDLCGLVHRALADR